MKTMKLIIRLIKLIKPLLLEMFIAIIMGVLGFLSVTLIAILGVSLFIYDLDSKIIILLMLILGVLKGIFKYLEQWFNHYIAFRVLAHLRDILFTNLRRLAPAKLSGYDKGELISSMSADIEILEAFYAHTISPTIIALIYSLIMVIYVSLHNYYVGLILVFAYIIMGVFFPIYNYKINEKIGVDLKEEENKLKNITFEDFKGLADIKKYHIAYKRKELANQSNKRLNHLRKEYTKRNAFSQAIFNIFYLVIICLTIFILYKTHSDYKETTVIVAAIVTSFKPVINVANVANILVHSFASGKRILSIVDEKEIVKEVRGKQDCNFSNLSLAKVSFKYEEEQIIKDLSIKVKNQEILGISGKSGSGKSTILKLIMRFYDPNYGKVKINDLDIKEINTKSLRNNQAYLTQETHLFKGTIRENLQIANLEATDAEIYEACKKASLHLTILNFKNGYDTVIGDKFNVSSGERQRIGLARAFLSKANLILLDEPTANLDALNEGLILKAIKTSQKTVVMVSHREKSLNICNHTLNLEERNIEKCDNSYYICE